MNHLHGNGKGTKRVRVRRREDVSHVLRDRAENVRDFVESVRDQAETTFRDKPYMVPVAACALGVGIGVLLGSRLTRFLVFSTVGAIVSDVFGGELKRLSRDFVDNLQLRLAEGAEEGEGEVTD
ncbi:hypothetical protein AKJ09_00665 [Labilithrix luteola]|uniref:Uncharacterized protein n=1 Tax=Labilithrix luteola TaxID=1391654 RepID=A0A0K1PKS5_9BACT|nr:hypothetical protein [Labilithrix luteola]AKU94001.1 hypothetical protein AKJ09_00665 [Labilithrix luteola]